VIRRKISQILKVFTQYEGRIPEEEEEEEEKKKSNQKKSELRRREVVPDG
jgi:hypothetical protein